MKIDVRPCGWEFVQPLREQHRAAMACQIVHDSLHQRNGWTRWFALDLDRTPVGYGAVVVGGPWAGTVTAFEIYVLPEHRAAFIDLAGAFVTEANVDQVLAQSNDPMMTTLLHQYGRGIEAEKIIFAAGLETSLPAGGAVLRRTSELNPANIFTHADEPVGEWALERGGEVVATGGYLGHYNPPYVDLFLEVRPDFRRRGFGRFLLQELQRLARSAGKIPGGRCGINHLGSRKTMAAAGMFPCAHVLIGQHSPKAQTA